MAKTYHILPSEVADKATTFDIMVMDVYATWERNETDKAAGRPADLTRLDPKELEQIWEKTKGGRRSKQKDPAVEDQVE